MVNYENGKVYKIEPIVEHSENEIYVGSTAEKYLKRRFSGHKSDYYKWKDGKCNKVMAYDLFDKYGIENCQIILLENANVKNIDELIARENHYIKLIPCINKIIVGRTKKEYYEDNKTDILEKHKIYYEENKEKVLTKNKEYRITHKEEINKNATERIICECGGNFTKAKLARHKKSPMHLEYMAKLNNEEYESATIICECGGHYSYYNKQRHLKTPKHQSYLNNL